MRRFGVNWLAMFGVSLAITVAVFSAFAPLYFAFALFVPPSKPNPVLLLYWGIYLWVNVAISVAREYGRYKDAVEGKALASWSPLVTTPIPFSKLWRQWVMWSSILGFGYGAVRLFTGQPPDWMLILAAFLAPAIILAAQAAQRRLYRAGALQTKNTVAAPAVTSTDIAAVVKAAHSDVRQNEEPKPQEIRNSR